MYDHEWINFQWFNESVMIQRSHLFDFKRKHFHLFDTLTLNSPRPPPPQHLTHNHYTIWSTPVFIILKKYNSWFGSYRCGGLEKKSILELDSYFNHCPKPFEIFEGIGLKLKNVRRKTTIFDRTQQKTVLKLRTSNRKRQLKSEPRLIWVFLILD